jgi:hypothetical protein
MLHGWNPSLLRVLYVTALAAVVAIGLPRLLDETSRQAAAAPPPQPATLAGHVVVFVDSGAPSATAVQHARAQCPPGTGVIAGGFSLNPIGLGALGIENYVLFANHPAGQITVQGPGGPPQVIHDGWQVSVGLIDVPPQGWSVSAYAVCVETT